MDQQHPVGQTVGFLSLPTELRNMVYGYALTAAGKVTCAPYEKNGHNH